MFSRKVLGGFIVLLCCMVLHISAYHNSKVLMCFNKHLVLHPVTTYSRCNGTVLTKDTQKSPEVSQPEVQELSNDSYILIMVDPDANSDPSMVWLHWLKTDITIKDLEEGVKAEYNDGVAYQGPSPPSGIHRYQFFLYPEKTNSLQMPSNLQSGKRLFNFERFKNENKLEAISNFQYLVSADEY